MSSPLADLQDSVSALHVTLRHLCRALEGNLGTWPTGDRLVAASSLQRLLETDALFSLLQDRARGAIAAAREARDSGASGASGGEATTPVGAYKTLADVPAGVTPASFQSGALASESLPATRRASTLKREKLAMTVQFARGSRRMPSSS